jgi:hypothetical protein
MIIRQTLVIRALLIATCVLGIHASAFAWGQSGDYQGNYTDPTPTPSGNPTPTPSGSPTPTATPVPPLASSTPDPAQPDNRYITVELEVATPDYSNLKFLSSGCTLNALIHFNARRTTYRGYFEGSARNPLVTGTPVPTTQPVTDPIRLTQAPTPPPATPTPSPARGDHWWERSDTAQNFANDGNRRRHHHQNDDGQGGQGGN